jgi:hypothetical protein
MFPTTLFGVRQPKEKYGATLEKSGFLYISFHGVDYSCPDIGEVSTWTPKAFQKFPEWKDWRPSLEIGPFF